MEIKYKKVLTLGDLIVAAYQVWGANRAVKIMRWAFNNRVVVMHEHPQLLISTAKGRPA